MLKVILSGIFLLSSTVGAEVMTFGEVWAKVRPDSAALNSQKLSLDATLAAKARADRHWLPRVYVSAKGYETNDPGAGFFGILEQRSLQSGDFNPNDLNHPDSAQFLQGSLGADLPLYEGGMRSSMASALEHRAKAEKLQFQQAEVDHFGRIGEMYQSINILTEKLSLIRELSDEIEKLLKGYQLGSKANPVGYSGLLGMRALVNRLDGLNEQYQGEQRAYYASLSELGLKNIKWSPRGQSVQDFVHEFFSGNELGQSFRAKSVNEAVIASRDQAASEQGKFLPRVGAFAETQVFHGDRDTASGYTAGLYLQWNLFNPSDYGALTEAKLKTRAMEQAALAIEQQDQALRQVKDAALEALLRNVDLLEKSQKLLQEQSSVARSLFRNGSINALQLVEVLGRRADLIDQMKSAQMGLLKTAIEKAALQPSLGHGQVVNKETKHLEKGLEEKSHE